MTMRNLLATTALVTAFGIGGAYAASPTVESGAYLSTPTAEEHLASNLIGETVYTSASDSAENLGDVNDLVVSSNGGIDAVVIGVGGFLGIGEKNVAVPYQSLQWQADKNGEPVLVLATTKDELKAAPEFKVENTAMAPADPNAPAPDQVAVDQTAKPMDQTAATPMNDTAQPMDQTAAQPAQPEPMDQTAAVPANPTDNAPAATTNTPAATVDVAAIGADELINTTVYGADDADVGEVGDVIVNKDGTIDAVVIDVGGFLGIGEKPVAIAFEDLKIARDENDNLVLRTTFTRDQLDAAPTFDKTAYQTTPDGMILRSNS